MTKKVLKALRSSIRKWQYNVRMAKSEKNIRTSAYQCPLCLLFHMKGCRGCPINEKAGFFQCTGSPYSNVTKHIRHPQLLINACKKEVKFLESLLPKKNKSSRRLLMAKKKNDKAVHLAHCNQGEYKGSCKYGDKDCPALKLNAVQLSYLNAECPDCGTPIPNGAEDGDSCDNCGHALYETEE
jgi:hypothetical protein